MALVSQLVSTYMYVHNRPSKNYKKEETNIDHPPSPKRPKPDDVSPQTPTGWTSPRKAGSTTSTPTKDPSQANEFIE